MHDNYANFAQLYDATTATDNQAKIRLFKQLISTYAPKGSELLELGCGTGNILTAFQTDFVLTGLDKSAPMLQQAALKVPQAVLIHGDMAAFNLGRQFDIILCVFDTINHLLEFSLWEQLFACVAAHLRPDGLFIFDINTFAKLRRRAADPPVYEQLDGTTQVRAQLVHEKASVFAWNISVRVPQPNGRFAMETIRVPEAAFPIRAIEAATAQYFVVQEKITGDETSATEDADRIYFACTPRRN